jgi:uncharacterized protein YpmS
VRLILNEVQLTSYLAARLQTENQPILTNPQVYLRDGQIQIFGTARQGYFQVNIAVIVTAGVDSQGQLTLELTSADFGPLPVPAGLKDVVTAAIRETYTGAIGPAAVGFRLESITVADGTLTVVGRTK